MLDMKALASQFFEAFERRIKVRIDPLAKRLTELDARIDKVEQRVSAAQKALAALERKASK
jgi:hypothetical protein